ncbi:MAG: hypothetical protein JNL10_07400 [Verrucomicrobiales bacterium]|nr:hypothetical protein [Verrucomicrobiales bacterium]
MQSISKQRLALGAFVIIGTVGLWRSTRAEQHPSVRVMITDYRFTNNQWTITALATNQGSVALLYRYNPAHSEVHWNGPTGWNISEPTYVSKWSSGGVLRPGKSLQYVLVVPSSNRRFKVRCFFEVSRLRDRAFEACWSTGILTRGSRVSTMLLDLTAGERREIGVFSDDVAGDAPQMVSEDSLVAPQELLPPVLDSSP